MPAGISIGPARVILRNSLPASFAALLWACGSSSGAPASDALTVEAELPPDGDQETADEGVEGTTADDAETQSDSGSTKASGSESGVPVAAESCSKGDCKYKCEKNQSCAYDCPGGHCEMKCYAGAHCQMECGKADCQAFCERGSDCTIRCPGGKCETDCAPGAKCKVVCGGGKCETTCQNGAKCNVNCPGGGCSTTCVDGSSCREVCGGGGCSSP